MKFTHLLAVAALLGSVVLADCDKLKGDEKKACKAKAAKAKAAKEKAAKEKAAKEKAAKEKAAKAKKAKEDKAKIKKAKEEAKKKMAKLAKESCTLKKLQVYSDKDCKKKDKVIDSAKLKAALNKLRIAMYNGACVEDKKDAVYIKSANTDCKPSSMEFATYSEKTCTTADATLKLDKYKKLANFKDIEFGKCVPYGKKWIAVNWDGKTKTKKPTKPKTKPKAMPKKPPKRDPKDKTAEEKQAAEKKKIEEAKNKKVVKAGGKAQKVHPYCKIKMTEYTGKKCEKVTADKKETAKMKKLAAAWTAASAKFKGCQKLKGKALYEKITCTKVALTMTQYTDPACTKVAKMANGKDAVTVIKWGKCMTVGGKTYKADVDKTTVFAKYMAIGSATLLALFATQF